MDRLPFNRPTLAGSELECIKQAVERMHICGNGGFTKDCETLLERTLGVPKVLLTTSCTHALEMAALLLDIQPGDEVILPSFTFVSTANAFVLRGATPVFIDIRPDTLNLDESKVEAAITANLSNARVEQINTQIRLIMRRGFGYHSEDAVIALAMLSLGGLCPPLPGR